jgi:hypothetical protein
MRRIRINAAHNSGQLKSQRSIGINGDAQRREIPMTAIKPFYDVLTSASGTLESNVYE